MRVIRNRNSSFSAATFNRNYSSRRGGVPCPLVDACLRFSNLHTEFYTPGGMVSYTTRFNRVVPLFIGRFLTAPHRTVCRNYKLRTVCDVSYLVYDSGNRNPHRGSVLHREIPSNKMLSFIATDSVRAYEQQVTACGTTCTRLPYHPCDEITINPVIKITITTVIR